MIAHDGFQYTFLFFGIGQGVIICLFALFLVSPSEGDVPRVTSSNLVQTRRDFTPMEIIGPQSYWIVGAFAVAVLGLAMWQTGILLYFPLTLAAVIFIFGGAIVVARGEPIFVLLYVMFVLVGAGGLMITANLAPIAKDFHVDIIPVTLAGITLPALTFAASLDRVFNGLTRPFFGWVSDKIGRENTMFIAFAAEGVGIYLLYILGTNPIWFVILSGLVFFAWGEIYSLFPSTCTDTFGSKFATTNAGLLYTAKGTAALLVPYSNLLQSATGNWELVFMVAAAANILVAALAIAVLKPWRSRMIERSNREVAA